MQGYKQSDQTVLMEKVSKTTIQKLYDINLFDNYHNGNKILKNFLHFEEDNERRKPDLEDLKVIFQ